MHLKVLAIRSFSYL